MECTRESCPVLYNTRIRAGDPLLDGHGYVYAQLSCQHMKMTSSVANADP